MLHTPYTDVRIGLVLDMLNRGQVSDLILKSTCRHVMHQPVVASISGMETQSLA